jgi:hypothetical protein
VNRILCAILCLLVTAAAAAVQADSVDVRVYSVQENEYLIPESGVIVPYDQDENILDYQIRLGIENDVPLGGILLGLRVWSDNVTWDWVAQDSGWGAGGLNSGLAAVTVIPGSRMDPVLSVWDMEGLLVTERDMDGSGADSILLGGVSLTGRLEAGPLESMLAIHFRIDQFSEVGWLCIDKAFIPPAGEWLFVDTSGNVSHPPTNCPVCYSVGIPTSDHADEPVSSPPKFTLAQNHPNPFNPATTITYTLGRESHVRLCVYNILGQAVRILVDNDVPAGTHKIVWDGTDSHGNQLASGVYLYRMTAGVYSSTRKMTLLR